MSDRLKFRAMSVKGEWQYGLITKDLPRSTAYYDDYPYRIHWHPESGGTANCPVRTETIGQWIGRYDSQGVKVFRGDIVRYHRERDFISEVVWYDEGCCFMFGDNEIGENISRIYVIGNIYENSELLEPKP